MNLEEIKQAHQELLDRYALIYQKLDLMGINYHCNFHGLSLEALTDNELKGGVIYPTQDLLFEVTPGYLVIMGISAGDYIEKMLFSRKLFENWETLAPAFSKRVQDKLRQRKLDLAIQEAQEQEARERAQLQNLIIKYGVPSTLYKTKGEN